MLGERDVEEALQRQIISLNDFQNFLDYYNVALRLLSSDTLPLIPTSEKSASRDNEVQLSVDIKHKLGACLFKRVQSG